MADADDAWALNVVAPSFDSQTLGGAGEVMVALVDEFLKLHPRVRICLNPVAAKEFPQWRSHIVEIPALSMRGNRSKSLALLRLAALGSRALPRDGVSWFPFGVMLPFNFRGRGVVTLHDTLERDIPGAVGPAENLFRRVMIPRTLRRCRVVTDSAFSRGRIRHHHDAEARVIPLALVQMPEPAAERPMEEPYVFYPANSWPHKNHQFLLDLWQASPGLRGIALVFTLGNGPGALAQPIEQARTQGVRVKVTGRVSRSALSTWYRHALCTAIPSLYEGFGLPVQEAVSLGCPVVVSPCGGVEEILGPDSPCALPLEPAAWEKAILSLQSAPQKPPTLTPHTWSDCAQLYMETFRFAASCQSPA